jgi:hypothetical protein
MPKQDPLLTVRLPEHLIVEFMAAAKVQYADASELIRKFVVETVEAAKKKDFVRFNEKIGEALQDREKRKKINKSTSSKKTRESQSPNNGEYLMSTGKGLAPDEQEIQRSKSDIKKARNVARSIERKRDRK